MRTERQNTLKECDACGRLYNGFVTDQCPRCAARGEQTAEGQTRSA